MKILLVMMLMIGVSLSAFAAEPVLSQASTGCVEEANQMNPVNGSAFLYKCKAVDVSVPVFELDADLLANAQSKLCLESKMKTLKSGDELFKDFGCGCFINNGYLSCAQMLIVKNIRKPTSGSGAMYH
jgi:hypothetical protein